MAIFVLDCFGGDKSPEANIKGAALALASNKDIKLILTGDEGTIAKELDMLEYDKSRISIVHAPDIIGCDEKPTEAIRKRKESSLVKGIELLRSDASVDGIISIGSTGAVLVGGTLRVGRLRGISRPAFCPILPSMTGGIVGVCDSGANMDCDAYQLQQFAVMGSLYLENALGVEKPRVALLNVGVEAGKGDELHKQAYKLLKATPAINFVGNMEGRDLLSGNYDLVVCDGFSGNVLIKSVEGAALEMLKLIKRNIEKGSIKTKLGAYMMKGMLNDTKRFMDYQNYGGSVMLGTKKIIVKGHGSSKPVAVKVCIEQAYNMYKCGLCDMIADTAALIPRPKPAEEGLEQAYPNAAAIQA